WELFPPEDRSRMEGLIRLKLSGFEQLTPFQARLVRRSGSPVIVGFYENLIEDDRGAIIGIRGILVNITEREQTMEALLASELKYRDLFDNVIDGVYQSTPDGRIITANPALVQLLGYESETELLNIDAANLYVYPE